MLSLSAPVLSLSAPHFVPLCPHFVPSHSLHFVPLCPHFVPLRSLYVVPLHPHFVPLCPPRFVPLRPHHVVPSCLHSVPLCPPPPQDPADYPLSLSGGPWRRFRGSFGAAVAAVALRCRHSVLYDGFLLGGLTALLTSLADSQVRAFRHTATLAGRRCPPPKKLSPAGRPHHRTATVPLSPAMKLMTALVEVALGLSQHRDSTRRLYEAERAKSPPRRAPGKLESLQETLREVGDIRGRGGDAGAGHPGDTRGCRTAPGAAGGDRGRDERHLQGRLRAPIQVGACWVALGWCWGALGATGWHWVVLGWCGVALGGTGWNWEQHG